MTESVDSISDHEGRVIGSLTNACDPESRVTGSVHSACDPETLTPDIMQPQVA